MPTTLAPSRPVDPARVWSLSLLAALAALNQLDRQLTGILLEPIRREFALSDLQLGLLSGLAFAVVDAALSFPAAFWVARHERRALIAAASAIWGAMTLMCGLAQSFAQLLIGRFGVGVGEGCGTVPSQAMISDLYRPGERAGAQAVWAAGINAGAFLAFLVGGYAGHVWGWRLAFLTAGTATLLAALLFRVTVREPARAHAATPATTAGPHPAGLLAATLRTLWGDPVLRHLCLGAMLTATVGYAALAWLPSYLVRLHGLDIASAGTYLAFAIGVAGALGTYTGGRASDLLRRRDIRWSLWLVALVYLASKPFSIAFYLLDDTGLALALFVFPAAVGSMFVGPSIAVLHERVAPPMRPVASAVLFLLINLVGLGLGPLIVGGLSQFAFPGAGADALRYALAVIQGVGIWGGLHYYAAGRRLGSPAQAKP